MIELNCTYEESKKILELGYDFGGLPIKYDGFMSIILTYDGNVPILPLSLIDKWLQKIKIKDLKIEKADWDHISIKTKKWEGLTEKHSLSIMTPFKAFLWCHENYPEELKKKFEEVMK